LFCKIRSKLLPVWGNIYTDSWNIDINSAATPAIVVEEHQVNDCNQRQGNNQADDDAACTTTIAVDDYSFTIKRGHVLNSSLFAA